MYNEKRIIPKDKILGCLMGGAVGDALGYPVEFMSHRDIVLRYGKRGIREFVLNCKGEAEISDDTQMSLFTATGIIFASTRSMTHGICGSPEDYVKYHYLDWYRTQTMTFEESLRCERHDSWLFRDERMYRRRTPGSTCMESLFKISDGKEVDNDSKGCGGIMRVAPVALFNDYSSFNDRILAAIAARCSMITHRHILSSISSAALVLLINRIVSSDCPPTFSSLEGIVRQVAFDAQRTPLGYDDIERTYYGENPRECEQLLGLLNRAINLAKESNVSDEECIREIGEGWVAEETLAIAVFCALRHPDSFEDAVAAAVNHDGDSDSTGAVCGNIMGALLGERAIPEKFTRSLELRDIIYEVADDLYEGCRITDYGSIRGISKDEAVKWISKYIEVNIPMQGLQR